MVAGVKRGDTVVTAGGLVGKVVSVVDDDEIRVDIADGVRVSVVRNTLSEVRPKGEVRGQGERRPRSKTEQDRQRTRTRPRRTKRRDRENGQVGERRARTAGSAQIPLRRGQRRYAQDRCERGIKSRFRLQSGGAKSSGSQGTSRTRAPARRPAAMAHPRTRSKDTSGDNA